MKSSALWVLIVSMGLSGCLPAEHWARKARNRIVIGMTEEQVQEEIGRPNEIFAGEPGQPFLWFYRFERGADFLGTVVLVIAILVTVGVIIITQSSFSFPPGPDPPDFFAELVIKFSGNGTVAEVSSIRLYRER